MTVLRTAVCLLAFVSGCDSEPGTGAPNAAPQTAEKAPAAAIAHAGVSSPPRFSDGCRKAVDAALAALEQGVEPVDAAVAGVVVLEDDPRFNAGTGSRVRIDGETVQMDASVMTSEGRFAAVAAIERVKNPSKVARAVLDTPHLVLAGEGATAFARTLGMPDYDPATEEMREAARAIQRQLLSNDPSLPADWRKFDWRAHWNFTRSIDDAMPPAAPSAAPPSHDTVGVAVRASDGRFAVALSTGGTSITLRGRVGDVPVYGAGLFASAHGAVAATGTGERIIEQSVGRTVAGWLAAGRHPEDAARGAVALIEPGSIGVIVIGHSAMAAAADRDMAWAGRAQGSSEWYGPVPAGTPPSP